MKRNMSSSMRLSEEISDDRHRNQISSSPKTPLYQSTPSAPNTGQFTSSISEKSVSSLLNSKRTSFDLFDIRQVLGEESSKKLLQTCATSWLSSRSLLYGNLVTIPILSEICIFQVIGANRLLADNNNQDWTGENSNGVFPRALKLVDHMDDAFVVDRETKVYLSLPLNLALEGPHGKSLPRLDFEYEDVKAKVGVDILKVGGLSKEYTILKDIIISSSVKDTLSSLGLRATKGVLLHGPPARGRLHWLNYVPMMLVSMFFLSMDLKLLVSIMEKARKHCMKFLIQLVKLHLLWCSLMSWMQLHLHAKMVVNSYLKDWLPHC